VTSTVTLPDGTTFCVEVMAAGPEPLLLIEGLGAHMISWREEFCHQLSDAGYTVIRLDNRDVGLSQHFPGHKYTLSDMAADTAGVIRELGYESVHVVGQSMGGMIAQELALNHPEVVLSLALICTAPAASYLDLGSKGGVDGFAPRALPPSREEAIEQYVDDERICASTAYSFDEAWRRQLGGLMWDRGWDPGGAARQLQAIMASGDRTERLRDISAPTVLIHGTSDALIPVAASQAIALRIAGARLTVIDGMGHEIPRPLWPTFRDLIVENARRASAQQDTPA
jgi:pimeloyl-ACP methyl ester carboxylesterase